MFSSIRGTIVRRVLVNYRVRPEAIERLLPRPFRPQLVEGWSIAGICLIELRNIRPAWLPPLIGCSSENAAHRVAVEWEDAPGKHRTGVFIPRRDSSSLLNHIAGGRLFPGEHHRARFTVHEADDRLRVAFATPDKTISVHVSGAIARKPPLSSVFPTVDAASAFFKGGCVGYSARPDGAVLDGVELRCDTWNMAPLEVDHVSSSYFEDLSRFKPGEVEFDSAFIMRHVPHQWVGQPSKRTSPGAC